jgi:hypothetical protein
MGFPGETLPFIIAILPFRSLCNPVSSAPTNSGMRSANAAGGGALGVPPIRGWPPFTEKAGSRAGTIPRGDDRPLLYSGTAHARSGSGRCCCRATRRIETGFRVGSVRQMGTNVNNWAPIAVLTVRVVAPLQARPG